MVKKTLEHISVRVTPKQKAYLIARAKANNLSLSDYIRDCLFDDAHQDKELAQILSMLGQGKYAKHLSDIAQDIKNGTLILSPDTQNLITRASHALINIRNVIIQKLGLHP